MVRDREQPPRVALDDFIEAFEAAQARDGQANLADFLPAPDHPLHGTVLRELIRVDLEYSWGRGGTRSLQEYQLAFPELSADRAALEEIAFEEYRLRRQAGQNPCAADYQRLYGVNTARWPGPHLSGSTSRSEKGTGPFEFRGPVPFCPGGLALTRLAAKVIDHRPDERLVP